MSSMRAAADKRVTVVWIAACLLAVASAVVTAVVDGDHRSANVALSVAVLGMGAAKAWLIVEEFMEVRTGPTWLRVLARSWLAALLVAIVVLYLQ